MENKFFGIREDWLLWMMLVIFSIIFMGVMYLLAWSSEYPAKFCEENGGHYTSKDNCLIEDILYSIENINRGTGLPEFKLIKIGNVK